MTTQHVALIVRDWNGAILDTIELKPGAIVTTGELRALIRQHRAHSVERVTTTERRLS